MPNKIIELLTNVHEKLDTICNALPMAKIQEMENEIEELINLNNDEWDFQEHMIYKIWRNIPCEIRKKIESSLEQKEKKYLKDKEWDDKGLHCWGGCLDHIPE